jgi:hypothetical protein
MGEIVCQKPVELVELTDAELDVVTGGVGLGLVNSGANYGVQIGASQIEGLEIISHGVGKPPSITIVYRGSD